MKTFSKPVKITIESDLLSGIPDHMLNKIVESTLNQIQKAYGANWWKGADLDAICEGKDLRNEFSVERHIEYQQFCSTKEVLNDEIEQVVTSDFSHG